MSFQAMPAHAMQSTIIVYVAKITKFIYRHNFTAENSEAVEWSVYVFDEAFDDGFRYISQAAEPVLVGDGTVSVEAGQFVYIYCSVNEFTADAPDENAKLNITQK